MIYTDQNNWPQRLYEKFTDPYIPARFDAPLASNYNMGFLLAAGPFHLKAGETERMSVALAFGADLDQLNSTVATVQQIYNANYKFTPDSTTATLASLIHVDASPDHVVLHWRLGQGGVARLERSTATSSWLEVHEFSLILSAVGF